MEGRYQCLVSQVIKEWKTLKKKRDRNK